MSFLNLKIKKRWPEVILTFLAPATKCNQNCPSCYITEIRKEPVNQFTLSPSDYALCLKQFIDEEIPVRLVSFQGYEVTLPKSWPYLEKVFDLAKKHNIRRSFITNGMLIHRYAEQIKNLEPHRISISLDGSEAAVNDPLRGLNGAFDITRNSLQKLLSQIPEYRRRIAVASTLYNEENFQSLLKMPAFLSDLGISIWSLSVETVRKEGGALGITQDRGTLARWLSELRSTAAKRRVRVFVNDELGLIKTSAHSKLPLRTHKVLDLSHLYRMDPLGHIYNGFELMREVYDSDPKWRPGGEITAPTFVGYDPKTNQIADSTTRSLTSTPSRIMERIRHLPSAITQLFDFR